MFEIKKNLFIKICFVSILITLVVSYPQLGKVNDDLSYRDQRYGMPGLQLQQPYSSYNIPYPQQGYFPGSFPVYNQAPVYIVETPPTAAIKVVKPVTTMATPAADTVTAAPPAPISSVA